MSTAEPLSNAWQNWYRFSRNPTAVIGAIIVISCVLAAILAPWITPSSAQGASTSTSRVSKSSFEIWVASGKSFTTFFSFT